MNNLKTTTPLNSRTVLFCIGAKLVLFTKNIILCIFDGTLPHNENESVRSIHEGQCRHTPPNRCVIFSDIASKSIKFFAPQ